MSLLDRYRANWPRVGAVIGMGVAGATARVQEADEATGFHAVLGLPHVP